MKNKKLALLAIMCLATAATTAIAGCKKKPQQQNTPTDAACEVSFANETLSMMVGDESALLADYTYQEGASLSYSSSDESVVKVDEYGRLLAIKEGTATITVRYGEASDTCLVTVTMNGLLPLIQLPKSRLLSESHLAKYEQDSLSGFWMHAQQYAEMYISMHIRQPCVHPYHHKLCIDSVSYQ